MLQMIRIYIIFISRRIFIGCFSFKYSLSDPKIYFPAFDLYFSESKIKMKSQVIKLILCPFSNFQIEMMNRTTRKRYSIFIYKRLLLPQEHGQINDCVMMMIVKVTASLRVQSKSSDKDGGGGGKRRHSLAATLNFLHLQCLEPWRDA